MSTGKIMGSSRRRDRRRSSYSSRSRGSGSTMRSGLGRKVHLAGLRYQISPQAKQCTPRTHFFSTKCLELPNAGRIFKIAPVLPVVFDIEEGL